MSSAHLWAASLLPSYVLLAISVLGAGLVGVAPWCSYDPPTQVWSLTYASLALRVALLGTRQVNGMTPSPTRSLAMTFDDYQACLNALFAADRQLNLVQARFAASGAAGATLDAFQLLRLAMVQCLERLEQQYTRQYPDHELADVCALLAAQRAPEGQRTGAHVVHDVLRRPAAETRPHSPARHDR